MLVVVWECVCMHASVSEEVWVMGRICNVNLMSSAHVLHSIVQIIVKLPTSMTIISETYPVRTCL